MRSWAGRAAVRGLGAAVFSPRTASRALGARVGHVFVATSIDATVLAAGFAGANRRRPKSAFRGGPSLQGRLAQLLIRQAVRPWLAPSAGRQPFITRTRGPCQPGAASGARASEVDLRGVGGGSHRLAGPVASRPSPLAVSPGPPVSSCTPLLKRRGHRLDAGPSASWDHEEWALCAFGPGLFR